MRPRGISQIVRVCMLSAAVLFVVSGVHRGVGAVEAQRQGKPKVPPTLQPGTTQLDALPTLDQPRMTPDPMRAHMDEERMKAMNDDRHKKLAADVERLLALSNELKSEVDRTNKDELSVGVIRKAAEIEKLAHDVQSRMKN